MKVLVAIANFGFKNCHYVERLISEYQSMSFDVDMVILSNVPKDLGANVEVFVGLPSKDPWSLPFGHKQLFAERQDEYDLFIYTEDDTLITQENIESFLSSTEELPDDKIAGFLRYEIDEDGNRFCCSMHSHYHWRPGSVKKYGSNIYAYYTNMHSACFMLTGPQLKKIIDSGGFLAPPHQGEYDLLVTAATDPYTQCGLEKIICVSRMEDFLLHHLPNQYLGKLGLSFDDMHIQTEHFQKSGEDVSCSCLLPEKTGIKNTGLLEKKYHAPHDPVVFEMIPGNTRKVLSIGCGDGKIEKKIAELQIEVDAIPLDDYISILAENKGVRCLPADWSSLFEMSEDSKFDLIFLSDILPFLDNPVRVLLECKKHLSCDGVILLKFHNSGYVKNRKVVKLIQKNQSKFTFYSFKEVKKVLKDSYYKVECVQYRFNRKVKKINKATFGLFSNYLASEIYVIAS